MDQAMTQTTKNSKRPSSPMDTDIPMKESRFNQPSYSIDSPTDAEIPAKKSRLYQSSTSTGGDTNRNSKTCNAFDMSSVKEKLENIATLGSGLKHNMHGPDFQLGMLMLVLWRAYVQGYRDFGLATELKEAEKFDDIVVLLRENDKEEWTLRLIQAKHKEGETITLVDRANLLAEDGKDFALQKYFHSFRKIKNRVRQKSRCCLFSEADIKDVLLVTNTGLTDELKNSFEIDEDDNMKNDGLLALDPMENTVKYKISESLMQDLKPILKRTSEFNQLVHTLAKSIVKKEQLNKTIAVIMEFIHPLRRDVFNCERKNGKWLLKFSSAFCNTNGSTSELGKFRDALVEKIELLRTDKMEKAESLLKKAEIEVTKGLAKCMQFDANPTISDPAQFARQFFGMLPSSNSHTNVIIDDKTLNLTPDATNIFSQNICVLGENNVFVQEFKKIRLSSNFFESTKLFGNLGAFREELIALLGKDKFDTISKFNFDIRTKPFEFKREVCVFQTLPQPIDESQFGEFRSKFRLIVNYPNRHQLKSTIQREMEKKFCSLNGRVLKALLYEQLGNWMSERIGTFYTHKKAEELFNKIGKDTLNYIMDGVTQGYFSSASNNYSFKTIEGRICSFLSDNDCHILYLEFEEIVFGRIRAVQTFKKLQSDISFQKYTCQFGYIFFTLDQLKDDSFQNNIARSFEDHDLWNLLVIECDSEEPQNTSSLLNILKTLNISERKIIFLADQTLREKLLSFSPNVLHQKVKTRFFDLTDQSQKEISANGKILFQESIRGLNNLLDDDSKELIDASTLAKLVAGKPIKVGNGLVFSMGYDENYYIERSIDNCVEINKNVTIKDPDILIKSESEEEFIEACNKHNGNIHWLRENCGRLFWQNTRGNISRLVKFRKNKIDSQDSRYNAADFIKKIPENEFIVTNEREKLRIISNTAGMGKTTILSNISRLLKSTYSDLWILRIDLNEYSAFFNRELKSRRNKAEKLCANDLSSGISFLIDLLQSNEKSRLTTDFELKLLENSLQGPSKLQVALLLDGFDEISPTYMEIVLDLAQTLQLTSIQKLIITTRPCTQKYLEKRLNTFAWRLNELSQAEQRWFLMSFWRLRLSAEMSWSDAYEHRLAVYVNEILIKYSASLNNINEILIKYSASVKDKHMRFTAIPLQLQLLAEMFEKNPDNAEWLGCTNFVMSTQKTPKLPERLNIFDLFENFVEKKFDIHYRDKSRQSGDSVAANDNYDKLKEVFMKEHEKMALYVVFEDDKLKALFPGVGRFEKYMKEIKNYIDKVETGKETRGIVNQVINGEPYFIHRSFAEYFVTNYIAKRLLLNSEQQSLYKILLEIFLDIKYHRYTIPSFFDKWLETKSSVVPPNTKRQIGECAVKLYRDRKLFTNDKAFFDVLCVRGFTEVVRFLCECLTYNHSKVLEEILNTYHGKNEDIMETTLLYRAIYADDLEMVKILVQHGAHVDTVVGSKTIFAECMRFSMFGTKFRGLNLCDLFEKFVERKFDVHYRTTSRHFGDSGPANVNRKSLKEEFVEEYEKMALYSIFHQYIIKDLFADVGGFDKGMIQSYISKHKTGGIVSFGWPCFIECSVAEAFVANYITKRLLENSQQPSLHEFLLVHVLSESQPTIHYFFNKWLETKSSVVSDYTKRQIGECAVKLYRDSNVSINDKAFFDFPCLFHHTEVVRFLCECLTYNHSEVLEEILNTFDGKNEDIMKSTLLYRAIYADDLEMVKILVQHGAHVNTIVNGETILNYCLSTKNMQILRMLASTTAEGGAGVYIDLNEAISLVGDLEFCQFLVERQGICGKDYPPFHCAAARGYLDICQWLISLGADVSECDSKGNNVLHSICINAYGDLKTAEWVVKASESGGARIDINSKNKQGMTILHSASSGHNKDMLQWTLEQGFDVNCQDGLGRTPLQLAIQMGSLDTVNLLLRRGANIDYITENCPGIVDGKKMISIQYAAKLGSLDIVRKLLTGKHPGYGNHDDGDTLLHFAGMSGNLELCQWLLKCDQVTNASLDVNSAGKGGRRMIHLAAMKSLPLVQWLVRKGANANCTDDKGFTVLHYAARSGKLEVCKWLAMAKEKDGAGLATNLKANDSSTILHAAASSGNLELCRWLLLEIGLDIKDRNTKNQTALGVARAEDHLLLVKKMQNWISENEGNLMF